MSFGAMIFRTSWSWFRIQQDEEEARLHRTGRSKGPRPTGPLTTIGGRSDGRAIRKGTLSHTPRFRLHRMRNIYGRNTASLAAPTTRTTAHPIDSGANLLFRLNFLRRVLRERLVSSAIDTAKS